MDHTGCRSPGVLADGTVTPTPGGCAIGYMDHTAVVDWLRGPHLRASFGVSANPTAGRHRGGGRAVTHSRVCDWSRGPYWLSSDHTGCHQTGVFDHTSYESCCVTPGCRQLESDCKL
jgi:hypothetical protein